MSNDFLRYINQKQLFESSQRILLTVSGGLDSVAMLHLFIEAKLNIGVAHCNFQLRGVDSEQDEEFVRQLAQKYNIPFFTKKFETKAFAQSKGISTQMAARELRYEWFEEIRSQNNYDFIATAHHQDDNLETILLNLTRGTGLAGLHGILPKKNKIIRPLLFASRTDLEQYVQQNDLNWREDISNQSTDYQRNLIRQQVLPVLKIINPNVLEATAKMANRVLAIEQFMEEQNQKLEVEIVKIFPDYIEIHYQKLLENPAQEERLFYFLKPYSFQYHQVLNIWQARNGEVGKQFLSETHSLTIDRQKFVVMKLVCGDTDHGSAVVVCEDTDHGSKIQIQVLPWSVSSQTLPSSQTAPKTTETNKNEIFVDADLIAFPLTVRKWQAGDWFCPIGMNGKRKKISDFLIDSKVPRPLKEAVMVLESNAQIVWVIGHRLDGRFKVTDSTKKMLKITSG